MKNICENCNKEFENRASDCCSKECFSEYMGKIVVQG